jgi:hypothetical protein
MRDIGMEKWSWFLNDAADRADANKPVVMAQAATPNAATDGSPTGNPLAAAAAGRYVAGNPRQWIGQPSVGTGECVALVRAATGAPQAEDWRRGVQVQGNTNVRPGTAIAMFDKNGRYNGHAAIYLDQDKHGVQVVDQWNIRDRQGHVTRQHQPSERALPPGDSRHAPIDRGEFYYVVE